MDIYQSITKEIHVYGNTHIPYACGKQRPRTIGACIVQTICDGVTLNELPNSLGWAREFVSKLLKNYPLDKFMLRANKCKSNVLYYQTIIDRTTRKEMFSIKIIN